MSPRGQHAQTPHPQRILAAIARQARALLVVEERRIEDPRPDEVVVRVVATSVCHTDIVVRNQDFSAPRPMVVGHEGAGVVEAVGSAVTEVVLGDVISKTFISKLIALHAQGRFPFDGLMRFHDVAQINEAIADSENDVTIKPILRMPAEPLPVALR
jgi:Zn-dependent alcohol dehydrogenase